MVGIFACPAIELSAEWALSKTIFMTEKEFADMVLECRREWNGGWSKEYREMEEGHLVETILEYMKNWLMIRRNETGITIFPSVGRIAGVYPDDFEGGTRA